MTELQFLIDLLLNHKLSPATKKHIAARIKEVEENQRARPAVIPQAVRPASMEQAPSTQRLLDQQAGHPGLVNPVIGPSAIAPAPIMATPIIRRSDTDIDKETGRPNIMTGNGTKGPRKW